MVFLQKESHLLLASEIPRSAVPKYFSVTARTQEYDDFPFFNGETDIFST